MSASLPESSQNPSRLLLGRAHRSRCFTNSSPKRRGAPSRREPATLKASLFCLLQWRRENKDTVDWGRIISPTWISVFFHHKRGINYCTDVNKASLLRACHGDWEDLRRNASLLAEQEAPRGCGLQHPPLASGWFLEPAWTVQAFPRAGC